ncbi:MAG: hypothetical protein LC792_23335 [Actinobacteria bacterium]|nr:hypothetical protein [Actinomycetota bacterium]
MLIPDTRNDENLVIAQTHTAFIRFHNRVVEDLELKGIAGRALFSKARTGTPSGWSTCCCSPSRARPTYSTRSATEHDFRGDMSTDQQSEVESDTPEALWAKAERLLARVTLRRWREGHDDHTRRLPACRRGDCG